MPRMPLLSLRLRIISKLYTRLLSREMSELDPGLYFEVLLLLSQHESPLTQNQIAEQLRVDKSRVVNIVYYLSSKELIFVENKPDDRRHHNIYLSPAGRSLVPVIMQKVHALNGITTAGIAENDLLVFLKVARQMEHNLETALGQPAPAAEVALNV